MRRARVKERVGSHKGKLGLLVRIWLGFAVLLAVGCVSEPPVAETPDVVFERYENVAAFDMLYPDFWDNNIVSEGLLVFAAPDQLDLSLESPTASMVVFRRPGAARFTLEEDHTHFLETGPLRSEYEAVVETAVTSLGGQEAFVTTVTNAEAEQPVTARIISTRTESGFLYTFTASAPNESWDDWEPNFQIMLGSVTFNE